MVLESLKMLCSLCLNYKINRIERYEGRCCLIKEFVYRNYKELISLVI